MDAMIGQDGKESSRNQLTSPRMPRKLSALERTIRFIERRMPAAFFLRKRTNPWVTRRNYRYPHDPVQNPECDAA
jgi:hypothetical protein